MRVFISCILSLIFFQVAAQVDSSNYLTVHFLYGSKPAKGCKQTESKMFGGIHGGHVSVEFRGELFSFTPKYDWHVFAHHKNIVGGFIVEDLEAWKKDTVGDQFTSVRILLTDSQITIFENLKQRYLGHTPYDYAFFGMRCAAAANDVLSHLGITKQRSDFGDVIKNFYPKRLRRKMVRLARRKNYTIIEHRGRSSRKWERD